MPILLTLLLLLPLLLFPLLVRYLGMKGAKTNVLCFDLRYLFPYIVNHICSTVKMLQSVHMQWYEYWSFYEQGIRSSEL